MKGNKFATYVVTLTVVGLISTAAWGGPLRMLAPGGAETAFGAASFSDTDVDYQRPADLINISKRTFSLSVESENVLNQKQGGALLNSISASKKGAEISLPLYQGKRFRSALAGNAYNSGLKLFTNDKVGNTSTRNDGRGSAFAFGQQLGGRFAFGYFRNISRETGLGASDEIADRVATFSAGTSVAIPSILKARNEGIQLKANVSDRFSASFVKSIEDYDMALDITDGVDDYTWFGNITGDRRETSFTYKLNDKYALSYFLNKADYENLDPVNHNSGVNVGMWLSDSAWDSKNFYLKKQASEGHSWMAGIEDYDGGYKIAGYIDVFGSVADSIAGYYLYHSDGFLHKRTYKYSYQGRRKGYKYRLMYGYSSGNAYLHFDSYNKTALTWNLKANENLHYNLTQHQLGIGLEKKIYKNTILKYALIQTVPLLDRSDAAVAGAGGGGAGAAQPSKKSRGGTLHIFSIDYSF